MAEYTKGKWEAIKWNEGYGFNIFGADGFVASVPLDKGLKHTMRECQANAHLIASAPDMYEALRVAETRIHNEIRHHPEAGDYRKMLQDELRQITKALLKADGKGGD